MLLTRIAMLLTRLAKGASRFTDASRHVKRQRIKIMGELF